MEKIILLQCIFYNYLPPLKTMKHCWAQSYLQGEHIGENRTWELWMTELSQTFGVFIRALQLIAKLVLSHCYGIPGGCSTSFSLFSSHIKAATSSQNYILMVCISWMTETYPKGRATGSELETASQATIFQTIIMLHLNLVLNSVGISQNVLVFLPISKVNPEVGWAPGDQCLKNNSRGIAVLQVSALRVCFMGSERGILLMLWNMSFDIKTMKGIDKMHLSNSPKHIAKVNPWEGDFYERVWKTWVIFIQDFSVFSVDFISEKETGAW